MQAVRIRRYIQHRLNMQQVDRLSTALQENRLVFAYGPSIDISALRILNAIQAYSTGTVFYAFKTNHEARRAYDAEVTAGELNVGLAVGDTPLHATPTYDIYSNRLVFCTTGKLRNIILEQIRREQLGVIGWVMIRSWEEYDANAYVVANLVRKYCPDSSIILLGYSEWSYLPYDDSVAVPVPLPQVRVEYVKKIALLPHATDHPEMLLKLPRTIFYGPEGSLGNLRGKVRRLPEPIVVPDAEAVIDTLKSNKSKPISKHTADIRADSIQEGIVYRLSTEEEFNALRSRDPIKTDSSLQEAIVHLRRSGIDPLSMLGPKHPQDEVKRIEASLGTADLSNSDLDKIVSLRLGIAPGIFYVSWTGRFGSGERNRYIPGLIASLIKRPPSALAPLESYKKFAGRNDIETLCNVWSSLLLSHSGEFWSWKGTRHVARWCEANGFHLAAITELLADMTRVCLGMKGDVHLFGNIRTHELNAATDIFIQIEDRRSKSSVPKNRHNILPSLYSVATEDILPILSHGNSLEIYVDRNHHLSKTPIRAEPVDLFFGM